VSCSFPLSRPSSWLGRKGHELRNGLAVPRNDNLFTRGDPLQQPRKLGFGLMHMHNIHCQHTYKKHDLEGYCPYTCASDHITVNSSKAVGVLTDNDNLKREGQQDQVVGEVKEEAERAAEK